MFETKSDFRQKRKLPDGKEFERSLLAFVLIFVNRYSDSLDAFQKPYKSFRTAEVKRRAERIRNKPINPVRILK